MSYIIYAHLESLIKKVDEYKKNLEESSTVKIGEHIPCGYSMSTIWGLDHIENNYTLYRGKDCMKKFCDSLREHTKDIIDFEKEKTLPVKLFFACLFSVHNTISLSRHEQVFLIRLRFQRYFSHHWA